MLEEKDNTNHPQTTFEKFNNKCKGFQNFSSTQSLKQILAFTLQKEPKSFTAFVNELTVLISFATEIESTFQIINSATLLGQTNECQLVLEDLLK